MGMWDTVRGWFIHEGAVPKGAYLIVQQSEGWMAIYSPDGGRQVTASAISPSAALTKLLLLRASLNV